MPITPTSRQSFDKELSNLTQRVDKAIWDTLAYIGGRGVREMRINGNYTDRTRNLRGSTGYILYDPNTGKMDTGGFQPVDGQGNDGAKTGRNVAEALAMKASDNSRRVILTAGMHYAEYVARKRNVTQSAKLLCEQIAPKLFANIEKKLNKSANK